MQQRDAENTLVPACPGIQEPSRTTVMTAKAKNMSRDEINRCGRREDVGGCSYGCGCGCSGCGAHSGVGELYRGTAAIVYTHQLYHCRGGCCTGPMSVKNKLTAACATSFCPQSKPQCCSLQSTNPTAPPQLCGAQAAWYSKTRDPRPKTQNLVLAFGWLLPDAEVY